MNQNEAQNQATETTNLTGADNQQPTEQNRGLTDLEPNSEQAETIKGGNVWYEHLVLGGRGFNVKEGTVVNNGGTLQHK